MRRSGGALVNYATVGDRVAIRLVFANPEVTEADITDFLRALHQHRCRAPDELGRGFRLTPLSESRFSLQQPPPPDHLPLWQLGVGLDALGGTARHGDVQIELDLADHQLVLPGANGRHDTGG